MKNKKFLAGLVVVAVLLSGTSVLYFAGVERVGVTPTLASVPPDGPPGGDCEAAGGFCAVSLGMDGGCNPVDCCPPGASWCGSWYRETLPFQEVGSDLNGTCWKYDGSTAPYCNEWWCNNFYICPAVYCQRMNPKFVRTRGIPVPLEGYSCGCAITCQ